MTDQATLPTRLEAAAFDADAETGRLLLEAAHRIAALTLAIHAHQTESSRTAIGGFHKVDLQLWAMLDGEA